MSNIALNHIVAFSEGLLLAKSENYYGFIDKQGKVAIPFKYDEALPFHDGLAAVAINGDYGYIDKHNNTVIPFQFDKAYEFSEGLAPVQIDYTWKFINPKGETIIELATEISAAYPFHCGMALVMNKEDKCGFINTTGELVVPFIYDDAEIFSDGLAMIERDGTIGYINTKGIEIIPPKFIDGFDCSEGFISVNETNSDGWIVFSSDGNEATQFYNYDFVGQFKNGYAVAEKDGNYGIIDTQGQALIPCTSEKEILYQGDLFCAYREEKWGAVNKCGKTIIPIEYDQIMPLGENMYYIRSGNRTHFILDGEGKVVYTWHREIWNSGPLAKSKKIMGVAYKAFIALVIIGIVLVLFKMCS